MTTDSGVLNVKLTTDPGRLLYRRLGVGWPDPGQLVRWLPYSLTKSVVRQMIAGEGSASLPVSPGSTAILIAALTDIIRLTETSTSWPQASANASVTSLRACLPGPLREAGSGTDPLGNRG